MEQFMHTAWLQIEALINHGRHLLDMVFGLLNFAGPAAAIFAVAFCAVLVTKFLGRTVKTKRYAQLRREFEYWRGIRREAARAEDPQKAKLLARNIDQAKLNKAYYDYFFEGLLLRLVTGLLPVLIFLAYVNEAYRPGRLLVLFGREYVFRLSWFGGREILVGAGFWFIMALVLIHLGWFCGRKTVAVHGLKLETGK